MTAPQIGNYGVTGTDEESESPQVAGFVMRDPSPTSSNWRAQGTLRDYLTKNGIVAIGDIDTRALTRKLRSGGVMRGIIATGPVEPDELIERAQAIPKMEGSDLVKDVTIQDPYDFEFSLADTVAQASFGVAPLRRAIRPLRVAAYDFGIKRNILRRLAAHGCSVRVFPASAPASELLDWGPDGIFLSNGPGDPAAVTYGVDNVRELLNGDTPVFGICLGHQLMGLALGANTFKLKFGHRGANHPVKQLDSGVIEITSQNHGFAVDPDSLPVQFPSDAPESLRRHGRGLAPRRQAVLLGAVPSRGVTRTARRGLPVRAVSGRNGKPVGRRRSRFAFRHSQNTEGERARASQRRARTANSEQRTANSEERTSQ